MVFPVPLSSLSTYRCKVLRSVIAMVPAAFLLAIPAPVVAEDVDQIGRLQIVHPWTRPAPAGGSTRLYLKIVNDGFDDLHVVKLTSPIAAKVRLILVAARGETLQLPSITVAAHETIDLGAPHFRVLLEGLRRDLVPGEQFPLTFHVPPFGRIETRVTVGDPADGGAS